MPGVSISKNPTMDRSWFDTENGVYPIRLTLFRVWDAQQTNLPGTAATDDLALITGTLGTDAPTIRTSDAKTTTITQYARVQVPIPVEYTAASTMVIRIKCGMITTVANGTATIDVQAYRIVRDGTVGADICSTAATTINSLTHSDREFTITATSLSPGDMLDIRLAIAITDAGTGTAVIGAIDAVELACFIRG